MNERLVNRLFMCNTNGVFFSKGGKRRGMISFGINQVRSDDYLPYIYIYIFFLFKWRRPSLKYLPLQKKRRAFINPHRNSFLIHIFSNRFQMRQNYESLEHVVSSYFTTLECCTWVRETFWEWHKWFRQPECANIIIRNSKQVDLIYKEWRRRKGSKLFCERIPYNTHFKKVWDQKKNRKKKYSASRHFHDNKNMKQKSKKGWNELFAQVTNAIN